MKKYTVHLMSSQLSWDGVEAKNEDDAIAKCQGDIPNYVDMTDPEQPVRLIAISEDEDEDDEPLVPTEDPFFCPSCNELLERVNVYSECYQKAALNGNKIIDYDSVEEILKTVGIECPNCGYDLKGDVIE